MIILNYRAARRKTFQAMTMCCHGRRSATTRPLYYYWRNQSHELPLF